VRGHHHLLKYGRHHVERLSPHPFQPSRREEAKTRGPRLFAKPRPFAPLMKMILPSALVISPGMGLNDLLLRASRSGLARLFLCIQRGGWCGLHCAHRATTVLSWGLCEHRDHASHLAILFIVRVLRARRMVWRLPIPPFLGRALREHRRSSGSIHTPSNREICLSFQYSLP